MAIFPIRTLLDAPVVRVAGSQLTVFSIGAGVAVLLATLVVVRVLGRSTQRLLERRGLPEGTRFAGAKLVRYLVTVVGVLVALATAGVQITALLAASAVVLVGIGLGLQQMAQNLIAGLVVLMEQPVRKGDFIRVSEQLGTVEDIGLRATRLLTREGVLVVVPNTQLVGSAVLNYAARPATRLSVKVGVAYGSDVDQVRSLLLEVASAHRSIEVEPPPEARLESFGSSSLDLALLAWITDPREDQRVASELRLGILAAFRRAGVVIPFPQRDIHLANLPRPAHDSQ